MKSLKTRWSITFFVICLTVTPVISQIQSNLPSFQKIAIGPRIHLVLDAGLEESIKIDYQNIEEKRIHFKVNGNTLRIYLDQARYAEKYVKTDGSWDHAEPMYEGVHVTAYVTYKKLKSLNVRGDQTVSVNSPIYTKSFSMNLQGACHVQLEEMVCGDFKANVYGDVNLTIHNGKSVDQSYKLYGNCEVNCLNFEGDFVKAICFGNSRLLVHPESLRMTAFGSSSIAYTGNPQVSKGLIVGDVSLKKIN